MVDIQELGDDDVYIYIYMYLWASKKPNVFSLAVSAIFFALLSVITCSLDGARPIQLPTI